MILRVRELVIEKLENRVQRRYAIDGVSFEVAAGEMVLVVGGPGEGKTALKSALLFAAHRVSGEVQYAEGAIPKNVERLAELSKDVGSNHVIVKDGFQARIGAASDPDAADHWQLFACVRNVGATLLAFTEIDRFSHLESGTFTRIIRLVEGRVSADGSLVAALSGGTG